MKHLNLLRYESTQYATFGLLIDSDRVVANTIERPWKHNKRDESCIPTGIYKVVRHNSPKFGDCFHVLDVENRDHILFHVGNYPHDTLGCILPGRERKVLTKGDAVANSKITLNKLKKLYPDGFIVKIMDATGLIR